MLQLQFKRAFRVQLSPEPFHQRQKHIEKSHKIKRIATLPQKKDFQI
jgi:hypothetical protein